MLINLKCAFEKCSAHSENIMKKGNEFILYTKYLVLLFMVEMHMFQHRNSVTCKYFNQFDEMYFLHYLNLAFG